MKPSRRKREIFAAQQIISPQRKQAGSLVHRGLFGAALAAGIALAIGCGGGGSSGRGSTLQPPPPADSFTVVTNMNSPRSGHTATRLNDGRVLIAGGSPGLAPAGITSVLATSELFDPASKSFAQSATMATSRFGHSAVRLLDGRVLVMGGTSDCNTVFCSQTATAELFDPATESFTSTGSMLSARTGFSATLLQDGRILVAGGFSRFCRGSLSSCYLSSAELFDPASGTFSSTGSMTMPRSNATATELNNGMVLIAGGQDNSGPLSTLELFDPAKGIFTLAGNMLTPRRLHSAVALSNGDVFLAGGNGDSSTLASTEVFEMSANQSTAAGSMTTPRANHTATLLNNGEILFAGGENDTQLLPDSGSILASAELFDPGSGQFAATASMNVARTGHTATLLSDGSVLVAGGRGAAGILADAEVFRLK